MIQSAGERKEKKTAERVEAGFEDLVKWHLKTRCRIPSNKTTQRFGQAYFKILKKRRMGLDLMTRTVLAGVQQHTLELAPKPKRKPQTKLTREPVRKPPAARQRKSKVPKKHVTTRDA
jgi:hypothetical protein